MFLIRAKQMVTRGIFFDSEVSFVYFYDFNMDLLFNQGKIECAPWMCQ